MMKVARKQYELLKDFAPVSTIGTSAYWVLVNPEVTKAKTMQELVAAMRANPGKMTYASGGSGVASRTSPAK